MPEYKTEDVKNLLDKAQEKWGQTLADFNNRNTTFFKEFRDFINDEAKKNHKEAEAKKNDDKDKSEPPQIGSYQTLMKYHQHIYTTSKETINVTNALMLPLKICLQNDIDVKLKSNKRKFTKNDLRGTWTAIFRNPAEDKNQKKVFTTQAEVKIIDKQLNLVLQLKSKTYYAPIENHKEVNNLYVVHIMNNSLQLSIHLDLTQQQQNYIFIGRYLGNLPIYKKDNWAGEVFLINDKALERHNLSKQNLLLPFIFAELSGNTAKINSLTDVYHDFNGSKPNIEFIPSFPVKDSKPSYYQTLNWILGVLLIGVIMWFGIDFKKNPKESSKNVKISTSENQKKISENIDDNTSLKNDKQIEESNKLELNGINELKKILDLKNDTIKSLKSEILQVYPQSMDNPFECFTESDFKILNDAKNTHIDLPYRILSVGKNEPEDMFQLVVNLYQVDKNYEAVIEKLKDLKLPNKLQMEQQELLAFSYFYLDKYDNAEVAFEKRANFRRQKNYRTDPTDFKILWYERVNKLYQLAKCDNKIDLNNLKFELSSIVDSKSPYSSEAKILQAKLICK